MALSLRTRLTAWYSVLLVLTVAIFSGAVLWLHWRLLLEQFDEGLTSISATAANVVEEELGELHDLGLAAAEMAPWCIRRAMRRGSTGRARPMKVSQRCRCRRICGAGSQGPSHGRSVTARMASDRARRNGGRFHYRRRRRAARRIDRNSAHTVPRCLIGIFRSVFAAAAACVGARAAAVCAMGAEAQAITATTLETRLTCPRPRSSNSSHLVNTAHRLGSALSTQRRFMADASHELRTPISIMRTAADVTLSRASRDQGEYREALAAVSQQASQLTRLVDDMLVLARADGGGYPVVLASVNLTALVSECVRELRPRADDKGITVRTSLEAVTLKGDDTLLRRMFSNLFGNALKYTPRGGSIDVSLAKADGEVVLHVADTGPGIPAEDRERVFERFVRLDPARGAGGAGLGLAIARWVAEAHSGRVRIVSSGSNGCVFAVSLPA